MLIYLFFLLIKQKDCKEITIRLKNIYTDSLIFYRCPIFLHSFDSAIIEQEYYSLLKPFVFHHLTHLYI